MQELNYERWESFDEAIARAMESCETGGIAVSSIFVRSRKWVPWVVVRIGR